MADPVSDFLAREQDALAGLDDDFASAAQGNNDNDAVLQNGVNNVNGVEAVQNGIFHNERDSGVDLSALDINDAAFNNDRLQNGREPSPAVSINSGRASSVPVEKEEPEKIRKWRENQKKAIAEKDKAEEKKKEELREQAKKELEEWHAQRKARLEQRKKDNHEREAKHFQTNENSADNANAWERIAKIVNDSKSNRGTKDTSRMKALYMQYGEVAPPTAIA